MLLVLLNLSLILQSIPPPTNYTDYGWVPYGFAALVAGQLFQIIRWIMKKDERTAERRAEAAAINLEALYKREERLATERSEKLSWTSLQCRKKVLTLTQVKAVSCVCFMMSNIGRKWSHKP